MKMSLKPCAIAGVFLLGVTSLRAQGAGVWSGAGTDRNWTNPNNWLGNTVPVAGSDVYFAYGLNDFNVTVDSSQTLDSLSIIALSDYNYDNYTFHYDVHNFTSPGPVTLNLGAGGLMSDYVLANFSSSISLNLTAAQTWTIGDAYDDPVVINGTITNNGNTLTQSGYGTLVLNGSNNLTGTYSLYSGALMVGNNNALGTATLSADYDGILASSGNFTLNNPISLNETLEVDTTLGSLTLAGPITAFNSIYVPTLMVHGTNPLNLAGTFTLGSQFELNFDTGSTVNLSGHVTSSGTPYNILINGEGTLLLNGTVDPNAVFAYSISNGKVIFGSAAALPTGGTAIWAYGGPGTAEDGYAGLGVSGVTAASFIANFDHSASTGTIGFDNGITINDPIDLTGFPGTTSLGSATTATLGTAAVITPQGTAYNFGGGGGTLTVASNLTGANINLSVISPSVQPLSLILSGTNTFGQGVSIDNSVLRFDNAAAFPSTGTFTLFAPGALGSESGQAYVGFDYNFDLSTPAASAALASRFSIPAGSTLVLGFDSPGVTVNSNTIDLSAFPVGTFLGTSTSLTVAGTVIGQNGVINLAAVKDGHLTVDTNLSAPNGLVIGLPGPDYIADPEYYSNPELFNSDYQHQFDDGVVTFSDARSTVTLAGNNSNVAGTVTLQGGRLELGNANALGTATLNVTSSAMLSTSAPGLVIPNAINSGYFLGLDTTANDFTLAGPLTGYGFVKVGTGTVSFTGDVNVDYAIRVQQGTLDISSTNFTTDEMVLNSGGVANFHTANPVLQYLFADAGSTVNIDPGTNLDLEYGGDISGTIAGGGALTQNYGDVLYVDSVNTYTGGTTINGGSVLANKNGALGPGAIVVNGGELDLGRGVNLTNALTFTSGTLGGHGTFTPSTGALAIGANQAVSPGLSTDSYYYTTSAGALTFGVNLTFAPSGTYYWNLMDAANVTGEGWSVVNVNGSLTITATPATPFVITLYPGGIYNDDYHSVVNFDLSHPYGWTIASATGGIVGFNAADFNLDTSGFDSLMVDYPLAHFDLVQVGNSIVLDFDPVPEPSTYVLMFAGLGMLLPLVRRRRRG